MRAPLASSRWLTCPRPDASAPLRMWCVPFAGGGAAVWHSWAVPFAGLAEIVAIRAPGRESRLAEAPLLNLTDYVSALVDVLTPYANEDYVLCGHSLGALTVFEMVRTLRKRGLRSPRALVVCGVRAPHHPPDQPWVHPMPRNEFIAEVERRYGAIPPEIRDHPEFLELLLPALRADLQMYETYRYVPNLPLTIPTLALGGDSDAIVSAAQIHDWRKHINAKCETAILPGGHFFPQDNAALVTERVRTFLQTHAIPSTTSTASRPAVPQRAATNPQPVAP